jgi:hypothetical protein
VICKKALTKWTTILKGKAGARSGGQNRCRVRAAKPLPEAMRKRPELRPQRLGSAEYCAGFLQNHRLDFEANSIIFIQF